MSIQLPPNPWVNESVVGACVATPGTVEASQQQLDRAFPKGTGRRRVILENAFIAQYCNHCPIMKLCGEYGKTEEFGIYGGRTEKQRKQDREMLKLLTLV